MWYFSWILGLGLGFALTAAIINAAHA